MMYLTLCFYSNGLRGILQLPFVESCMRNYYDYDSLTLLLFSWNTTGGSRGRFRAFLATSALSYFGSLYSIWDGDWFGDASVNGTIFLVKFCNAGYFQLLIIFLDLMIVLCWCFWDSSEKFISSLVSFSIVLSWILYVPSFQHHGFNEKGSTYIAEQSSMN